MSITPNGQAPMHARQPLQTSDWITTVSNSVRMIAPVGHTSRQPAWTQCLHTSDIISQRPPTRFGSVRSNCSTKRTWRNVVPDRLTVLSYDIPDIGNAWPFE